MERICRVAALVLGLAYVAHAQTSIQVGYATLTADSGNRVPVASALFAYRNSADVLISEAAVGGTEPIRSGRIFVDEAGTQTGIALANPSSESATITLILRSDAGVETARQPLTLLAGEHRSRYVSQLIANPPPNFVGTLTFESTQPLAAVALRESRNAYAEPLYSTLPVVDVAAPPAAAPVVFPHIAIGGGYSTQIVLINPGADVLEGRVDLITSDGRPLQASLTYRLAPHGTYRAELGGAQELSVGYATLTPSAGRAPAGTAIFQYKSNGAFVTEAGVAAIPATTAARLYVDYLGTQTGFAVANAGGVTADLTITLMDRYGLTENVAQRTLPPGTHLSLLAHELFSSVSPGYSGLLEIRSSAPVVPIAIKVTTVNTRDNLVLTTLPVADLTRISSAPLVFPQIAFGLGFSTRLILLNADPATPANGRIAFRNSDSSPMTLPMSGQTASQFAYPLGAGAGRQLRPGDDSRVSAFTLIDASTRQPTAEFVINEGSVARPRVEIRDSRNNQRDDFDVAVASLDSDTAAVDAAGRVQGKKAGFATLTMAAGGLPLVVTATVVKVGAGAAGFETTGIAQDTARRLYLASPQDHSILQARDPAQAPQVYAGIARSPGLKDDIRAQSLFRNPAFLVLNQADGSLYVSDESNHVIRRVGAGSSGRVDLIAGTGQPGRSDGAALSASFTRPEGIALDGRGYLWIADSGNHTIRRMNLATRQVETIAGQAGVSGVADGRGSQARFNLPSGIAVEVEAVAEQLDRQRRGLPTPPVRIVVADSGNGAIRRVYENGDVETIRVPSVSFDSPSGVAVDPSGNLFVTEPQAGRVRVILKSGGVVAAAEAGTFAGPKGVAVEQSGRVIVSGRERAATELTYGTPGITGLSPDRLSNRGGQTITITGNNFAPDTLLVVSGVVVANRTIRDTRTITFTAPALPSGRGTVTVQNRGGIGQAPVIVDAVPLRDLPAGNITTVAGGGTFAGEGAPARSVSVHPLGIAVDTSGNLFIVDTANKKIRRVDSRTGTMTTIAGSGQSGYTVENGPAIAARFSSPKAIAFDSSGNLLIADDTIRRVDMTTGIITTVAGEGYGSCGDGGDALKACFIFPMSLATDTAGNLYIADGFDHRVRRVDARTNIITTVAGTGERGFAGDSFNGRTALLNGPAAIAADNSRNVLYIADSENNRIRKLELTTGIISTFAGGGTPSDTVIDNIPAVQAALKSPIALALDSTGNLYISDRNNARIRMVDIATGIITTVAGNGGYGASGDGELATEAPVHDVWGIAVDGAGNLIFAEADDAVVRKVDANTKRLSVVAGTRQAHLVEDNVPATAIALRDPTGVSFDRAGNLLIVERGAGRIRQVDPSGTITTIAGGGNPPENAGDGGIAINAALSTPSGRVAVDPAGNLYFADTYNYRVRRIDAVTRIISRVAGNGDENYSGDGGPATSAGMLPNDVAVDGQGNLFIADGRSRRIRKVNLASGTITTFAGGGDPDAGIGEGVLATRATLGDSLRIAVDSAGNLFIADTENRRVRRVDARTQFITTVAGGGSGYEDGKQATAVDSLPISVEIDGAGNLFIVDLEYPGGIRRVAKDTGIITNTAGSDGVYLVLGDNGPAKNAFLYYPDAVALDATGNLFIADTENNRIRAVRAPIP